MSYTQKAFDKLPEKAKTMLLYYKKTEQTEKAAGYIRCIADIGIITETERRLLHSYITL